MRIGPSISVAVILAIAACGDTGSDSLTSRYSRAGDGPSAGSSSGTGTDATGGSGSGGGGGSSSGGPLADGGAAVAGDAGSAGRALFEALLPTFDTTCGGACHQAGSASAPPYLGGADPYATIQTYQGMIVNPATQSILLTKGQHEGPALADPLKTSITNWLTVEAAALAASGPVATPPITIAPGANTVDLSPLGVAGVSLSFTASITSDILTLDSVQISAPAATGIKVAYPIFYVESDAGTATPNDDMSNVSQTIAAGATATLGTGILVVTGWASGDTMQISFTQLAKATVATDGGASGGCKSVAVFTSDAVPAIQANTCLDCHNTGGSGNAALDLSALALATPDYATACAQALTRANPADPSQSDIILAPTGQVAMHPFKTASASFVTMMETWISAEN